MGPWTYSITMRQKLLEAQAKVLVLERPLVSATTHKFLCFLNLILRPNSNRIWSKLSNSRFNLFCLWSAEHRLEWNKSITFNLAVWIKQSKQALFGINYFGIERN